MGYGEFCMTDIYLEYCLDGYHLIKMYIDSYSALTAKLDQIRIEAAELFPAVFCVDIVIKNTGRLAIGLDDKSMLMYTSEDFEESLTSLGDRTAQGETMFYSGDYCLMSNKYIISYANAMEVVKTWFYERKISDIVEWADVLY